MFLIANQFNEGSIYRHRHSKKQHEVLMEGQNPKAEIAAVEPLRSQMHVNTKWQNLRK